jgi:hypothetical protein
MKQDSTFQAKGREDGHFFYNPSRKNIDDLIWFTHLTPSVGL